MCVLEIKDWMTQNLLKLNAEKTEVIYITTPHFQHKFEALPIHIDGETVYPSASARNIGVIFDKYLSLHEHISSVCRTCVYHLRNISAMIDKGFMDPWMDDLEKGVCDPRSVRVHPPCPCEAQNLLWAGAFILGSCTATHRLC